jgi:small subunit ribosomal protein S29
LYICSLFRNRRSPVLLAIDDFQALFKRSKYRDPQFREIESYHLSLPRLILEYANATRRFKRGAVVGAIGSEETRLDTSLELAEALGISSPAHSPYSRRIKEYIHYTNGLEPFEVHPRLSIREAAAVFDFYKQQGALHSGRSSHYTHPLILVLTREALTDETFLAKYTESDGNARDFVTKGLLATLQ